MSDLPYILSFSVFPGIGPIRFKLLYTYFGSAKHAWEASENALREVGLPESVLIRFLDFRKKFSIGAYTEALAKKRIRTITFLDPEYPARLREISDAPFVLYCAGTAPLTLLSEQRMIAVVGTRRITPYGKEVTTRLVTELVDAQCIIVSGLALGVDTIAHEKTLRCHGKTVAVLGCGVDVIAPASNTSLYFKIQESGGLIVSEMPLTHTPGKGLFPARNRIISGLCLGVVVTEGAEDSGALITARNSAEQGREVFAVPGPITSILSKGPAKLIKDGATLVESAEDILNQLQLTVQKRNIPRSLKLSSEEQWIIDQLNTGPKHIDEFVRMNNLPFIHLSTLLTTLEVSGIITKTANEEYVLS